MPKRKTSKITVRVLSGPKKLNSRQRKSLLAKRTPKEVTFREQMKRSASFWRTYDADTRRAWNAVAAERSLSHPRDKPWTGYQAMQSASAVFAMFGLPGPPPPPPRFVVPATLPPLTLTGTANAVSDGVFGSLNGLSLRIAVQEGFDEYAGDVLVFGWKPLLTPAGSVPKNRPAFLCALSTLTGTGTDIAAAYASTFDRLRVNWRVLLWVVPATRQGFRGTPQAVEAIVGANP